jgi:hypothetical protein
MDRDSESALRAMNAKFINNFVTNDVRSHDAIIHERFTSLMSNGLRLNRKDYLVYWKTAFNPEVIIYWDYRDERITVFGNVGLVYSVNKHVRMRDGVEITGMTNYTDIYLQENGIWKCIQAQLSAIQPEHYPSDDTIVTKYIKGKITP